MAVVFEIIEHSRSCSSEMWSRMTNITSWISKPVHEREQFKLDQSYFVVSGIIVQDVFSRSLWTRSRQLMSLKAWLP